MARILKVTPSTQEKIKPHKIDEGVECEYKVLPAEDGPLVHLSTFGSQKRASHRKSSQSMQFNEGTAKDLTGVFHETFGDSCATDLDLEEGRLVAAYRKDPQRFRQLITDDETARDVVALAHRRKQVTRFRRLLNDDAYFAEEAQTCTKTGTEPVWQRFFEENPWIFGVSLAGQLLTSWSREQLEQIVAGSSISGVGKRTDALLRTAGRVRSLVFVEFKTHKKDLLVKEYRSGCWVPSPELSGGVVQAQGTVYRAIVGIGEQLQSKDADGSNISGDITYLLRPRTYLVIGNLESLRGEGGGDHEDKIRSFELYRRQLVEPEILTFDELLARAEWLVTSAVSPSDASE
ncbi:Shedu immune nuclease family protein [Nocardia sp. NPDC051756]|uniref:Shedu immune nuclease family protein n=1 Tax=Nocardia sp. NPDC051756 TaxID=3154751 RepID=UPI003428B86A